MKSINEITLYDLMSEDLDVWIKRNKKFGYDLQIDDVDGEILLDEEGIHYAAMESFAELCRRFLNTYDNAKGVE